MMRGDWSSGALALLLFACASTTTTPPPSPPPARAARPTEAAPAMRLATTAEKPTLLRGSEPAPRPEVDDSPPPWRVDGPDLVEARRVSTGVLPKSVVVSPDGTRLYVCNFGYKNRRNVTVYDAQSLAVLGQVHFAGNAAEAALSADGKTLYVSNFGRGRIEIVDTDRLRLRDEVRVGSNPKFIVIDDARSLLYVSNWSSGTVSAVDLRDNRVVRRLQTGRRPRGMAVLDDGTLFVGAMWDHKVQVYRTREPPPRRRILEPPDREFATCENPRHLMLSPDQSRLYVSCSGERLLQWFDPETGEVLGEAPTGRNPRTIDISESGRHVVVADFTSSTLTVVDTRARRYRTHAVPRTREIVGLALAPGDDDGLTVYATSWQNNQLVELRMPSDEPSMGSPSPLRAH